MTTIPLSPRSRRRLVNRGLDALTWVVVVVMLAPIGWLVASALQTDGQLARGAYDLLHPTFTAPAVRPRTNHRCVAKKATMTGIVEITPAAISCA